MDDLLVLCYHGVSESWPDATSVEPEDFERQLRVFTRRGYRGATLSDALANRPTGRTLVVTFDDAQRSVYDRARPVMDELGVPGTVFVPTAYAGGDRPMGWSGYDRWLGTEHEDELLCMGWDQLGELASKGWEVGSHTRSHPRLSRTADAEIEVELEGSKADVEEALGGACRSFAYPYSDYDRRAVDAAAGAGYECAVTVPRAPAEPSPLEWPRVGVFKGESAGRIRLRAWSRRGGGSRAARAALALRRLAR